MSIHRHAHRRAAAVTTAAITALAALGAATPALAATPAAGTTTATPSTASTPRPVPPRIRALLRAEAERASHHATAPRAAGLRPIPGTTVSTDLPSRVEIGGPTINTVFRTTVSRPTTGYVDPVGVVGLFIGGDRDFASELLVHLPAGQRTFAGALATRDSNFTRLGAGLWSTGIVPYEGEGADSIQLGTVPVTVKLRSLLGQRVTRAGSTVAVFASTKTYDGDGIYRAAAGRTVYVQRYTANGWQTLRTLTADRNGHIDTRVTIPYRAAIRVTTRDTATTFGAITRETVL